MNTEITDQGLVEEANTPSKETVCEKLLNIRNYLEDTEKQLTCITQDGKSYQLILLNGEVFCSAGSNSYQLIPRTKKEWQKNLVLTEQSLQKLNDFETKTAQKNQGNTVRKMAITFNELVDALVGDRPIKQEPKQPVKAEKKQEILDDPMIQQYLDSVVQALQVYKGKNSVNSGEPDKSKLHKFVLFEQDKNAGKALQNLLHYILGNKITSYGKEAVRLRDQINKKIILEMGRRMGRQWEKEITALFSNKNPDDIVSILYFNSGDPSRNFKPHSGVIYILERI